MKIIRSIKIIFFILPAVFSVQCGNMLDDFFNDPDNTGTAQWATPVKSADDQCAFNAVAVDSEGNAYAVGYVTGNGTYDFGGNNENFTNRSTRNNAVIVKYNSFGAAQWATSVEALDVNSCQSEFKSVAVDGSGNVYVVGVIEGNYGYRFGGNSDSVYGIAVMNTVIVKYNSNGVAQWARTVESASDNNVFNGIAVDEAGNSYAVGYIGGLGAYTFDFGGLSHPVYGVSGHETTVIVKYNSSGVAQWATPVKSAGGECVFNAVAVDRSGNAYAVGTLNAKDDYSFDGTNIVSGVYSGFNTVIVKYNTEGVAQWATAIKTGNEASVFNGVAVDRSGNAYAVGFVSGIEEYSFGGVCNPVRGKCDTKNSVIVKYNPSGAAQWATPISDSSSLASSIFSGAAVDVEGNIYAAGELGGIGSYDFGGVSAPFNVSYGRTNTVIVKYNPSGVALWATPSKGTGLDSSFKSVAVDHTGYTFAVGYTSRAIPENVNPFDFGGKSVPFNSTSLVSNTVIVKYY